MGARGIDAGRLDRTDGIAMAIITDTALSLGLWPDGFTLGEGGRTYHYRRS
ncbi:hypothetical protein GCM10023322_68450 [Rugosimonospora acidiphila]|uniref:Uncharacterized protein n=1 Tax=Rugosimonospora acidiphila TaxID=556531 RepID=A0ABP9SMJ2_9ACTN